MKGYFRDPGQTKKVLHKGWLCTGDLAYMDRSGFLYIKGRRDDLIIRAGMNIYPAEIEGTLKTDQRVKEAYVYKIEHPHTGQQIGLKLAGDFRSVEEVRQLCARLLPPFQMPIKIDLLEALPKSASGKIIRR